MFFNVLKAAHRSSPFRPSNAHNSSKSPSARAGGFDLRNMPTQLRRSRAIDIVDPPQSRRPRAIELAAALRPAVEDDRHGDVDRPRRAFGVAGLSLDFKAPIAETIWSRSAAAIR